MTTQQQKCHQGLKKKKKGGRSLRDEFSTYDSTWETLQEGGSNLLLGSHEEQGWESVVYRRRNRSRDQKAGVGVWTTGLEAQSCLAHWQQCEALNNVSGTGKKDFLQLQDIISQLQS